MSDRWLFGSALLAVIVYGGVVVMQCKEASGDDAKAVESQLADEPGAIHTQEATDREDSDAPR